MMRNATRTKPETLSALLLADAWLLMATTLLAAAATTAGWPLPRAV